MRKTLFTGDLAGGRRGGRSWTPRALLVATILSALSASMACSPTSEPEHDFGVELSFSPELRVGETTCAVQLSDASGTPLRGAMVEVEGNMNHAGMVPVFGTAEETAPGRYEAPLEFTMGGDWFVIVHAELADGSVRERIVDVLGVAPARGRDADPPHDAKGPQ
jgi:hypothetical protein